MLSTLDLHGAGKQSDAGCVILKARFGEIKKEFLEDPESFSAL
jgi:hypothetical protein